MISIIYTCVKYCGLIDKFYSICGILLATAQSKNENSKVPVVRRLYILLCL